MAGGRPLKFKSPEEMQEKIDAYFARCEEPKLVGDKIYFEPVTITGLALALGTYRDLLCNYEERDEFYDTIRTAKQRVEHYAEKQLYNGPATGPIFALKNHGWKDAQDMNLGGQKGNPVEIALPENDRAALEHYFKTKGMKDDESTR